MAKDFLPERRRLLKGLTSAAGVAGLGLVGFQTAQAMAPAAEYRWFGVCTWIKVALCAVGA